MRVSRINRVGRSSRAGGGVANSLSLPGLYAAMDVFLAWQTGRTWQDEAMTTRADNGDPVTVIFDPFSGVKFEAPDDTNRPTLNVSGGKGWLDFDGTDNYLSFDTTPSIPLSFHVACRWEGASIAAGPAICGGAINSQKFKAFDNGTYRAGVEGVSNWTAGSTAVVEDVDHVAGINYGSAGVAVNWLNGSSDGTADADVTNDDLSVGVTLIGRNAGGDEWWNGRMYGWGIYTRSLATSELASLHAYLSKLCATPP